ncbi:TonB-dependent receptor [Novosphingobium album (ex Liu et al. 2023)]|uniref:TonB-dependent receptor n=1 Tax=Novosphingobium album (ex Liu et al. 2023) TaxID=3031130 RepID=A0ABT5WPN0_9SPHN|nr:TonB-dependent receptor [Novosphingobium album (ex Liu et al. 2023)]MDE8652000.1 TonB-dependent receptor [Novosphingobium album (ex Liu et al. 2023)]
MKQSREKLTGTPSASRRGAASTGAAGARVRGGLLLGASLLGLCAPAGAAMAQDAATAANDSTGGIEEITVTARRRAESLQDTPIAISAVTSEGLVARGIDNVTQIGDFTPNVKFNSSVPVSASNATAAIFIRGIGQNDYQLSADPGVGLYLDGVYISRGVGNVLDVLNVERIEVLRGPQGTLFGRNTIGGAVSVVTKKPGDTLAGSFELTTGRFGRFQAKGSIDLPLAEGVYSSFAGFIHKRDGYVKGVVPGAPDLGDTDNLAGRFALRLEPSSNVTIDLAVDGSRTRENSAPNVAIAIDENATAAAYWNAAYSGAPDICANSANPARFNDQRCFNSQWALGPYKHGGTFTSVSDVFTNGNPRRYQSGSDVNIWGASGTIEWKVADNVSLKSITAYRKVTGFWTRDSDHSPATIVQTNSDWKQDQFSQELQVLGDLADGKVNWVVGGYYSDESGNHKDLVNIVDAVFLSGAVLKGKSLAFFGQGTWEIVPDLNLTAGIRWTEDKKTFGNANQYVVEAGFLTGAPFNPDGSGLADGDPLMGPLGHTATIKDKAWTPMVSLSYRFSPELLTYVSYSEGFKGGGFTQRVFPPFAFIPSFKPETSTTYEFGFKSDLLDRRVRLNGAVFLNDYDNLQITVNDPTLGFAPIIQNAAKARIKGFELELQARPVGALLFEAGLGYLDAKYRKVDIRALNAGVTTDTRLQNAPKWTMSAGVSYTIDASGLGSFQPRVDWSYRSKVYNDAVNTPLLVQDGYHLVNASVAFNDESERWGLTLGVKNLTKEVYLGSGYADSFGGIVEGVYGRPREWYLSAKYKF